MVDKILEELYIILENLNSVFKELTELAKEKQPILIKGTIESLDELTKKEQILIVQVGRLEERRYKIQQALANHFSISVDDLNISFLSNNLSGNDKKKFEEIFESLNNHVREVKELNDSNAQLIQQSLDFIDYSINIITSNDEKPTYPDKGVSPNRDSNFARIFDQKI